MSADLSVTALRVANESFLVSSMIERCPKTMMLRELIANSIEAASRSDNRKLVTLTSQLIDGVPKLCLRNTGPGLSAAELDRICDLASTLHKESGLDANFGMGAKVASLPSNKHGMRYRSCKQGVVSEVILGQRDGVYGRLRRAVGEDGGSVDVVDATQACRAEGGYDLSLDWTEVVLFGNSAAQNTLLDPYAGNPPSPPNWRSQYLLTRFFRAPEDVVIEVADDMAPPGTAKRRFIPMSQRLGTVGQFETVRTASGIAIHYLYMPPKAAAADPDAQELASLGGLGCIVYKGEIYDIRMGSAWTLDGPTYGISFGAHLCAICVELPDNYLVRPEAYRQFLRFRGGDQRQVFLRDFGLLVRASVPAWLAKIIRSLGPAQSEFAEEVEKEMRDLLAELGVEPQVSGPSPLPPTKTPSPAIQPLRAANAATPPASQKPPAAPAAKRYERPAEIVGLDDDELIQERGLQGRAAKYYPTSHQLFVNLKYGAIGAAAEHLEREFAGAGDPEPIRRSALSVARWIITRKVARSLVYSLSKKAAGWPLDDIRRSQSPEALSLVADDWLMVVETGRARMEAELGPDGMPAGTVVSLAPRPETQAA